MIGVFHSHVPSFLVGIIVFMVVSLWSFYMRLVGVLVAAAQFMEF